MQETLRNEVKYLKLFQNIKYSEISDYLEIKRNSFYNWLNGAYNLSDEKIERLKDIITNLKE